MPPAICPSFQRLSGLLWSVLTWRHILSKLSFLLAFSEAKGMCELHVVSAIVPVWSFQITIATVSLLIYAPLLGGTGFSPQLFVDESSLIHFVMYSLCASSWIGKKRKEKEKKGKQLFVSQVPTHWGKLLTLQRSTQWAVEAIMLAHYCRGLKSPTRAMPQTCS